MPWPPGHFLFLVETGGHKTGPLQTRIRLVSRGPAAVNGCHVGGCRWGVCLSPPRVISAWWPRPRRHQRAADVICSHSAVTCGNGNQCRCWEGGFETERDWTELVGPYIYLPDTLNSEGPAESHHSRLLYSDRNLTHLGALAAAEAVKDSRWKSTWLIG